MPQSSQYCNSLLWAMRGILHNRRCLMCTGEIIQESFTRFLLHILDLRETSSCKIRKKYGQIPTKHGMYIYKAPRDGLRQASRIKLTLPSTRYQRGISVLGMSSRLQEPDLLGRLREAREAFPSGFRSGEHGMTCCEHFIISPR